MNEPLLLADASKRMRKPAGRPRKVREPEAAKPRRSGAVAGQASAPLADPPTVRGFERPVAEVWPRLLGLAQAAAYLSLSVWTIREYLAEGILRRVELPSATCGTTRRVLLDRADLDRLVDAANPTAEAVRPAPGSHG
jgi:hypothetical protein